MKIKFTACAALVMSALIAVTPSFAADTDNTAVYLSASAQEVVISADTAYADIAASYSGDLVIKGLAGTEKLTLASEVSLKGNLKIEGVVLSGASTLYANGYTLEIASNVTSDSRLTVYGGKKSSALTGNTNLILLGGLYNNIFAGGNGGAVNGNTNVVLGGNANTGDGIDDSASNISTCFVYGGGNNATVTGKTNVTLTGSAVAKYLVGAGYGTNGTATDTNVLIEGGKVMNVYTGSRNTTLTGCNAHFTMTGGFAEAVFGGCESTTLTGNTYLTFKGGEVSRRVYTGCYNNADSKLLWLTWASTNNRVIGTTNLTLYPEAKLATGTGLSGTNGVNKGVFSGSRIKSQPSDEKNTIIYMNDSYSSLSGKIGENGSLHKSDFKSFHNYVIKVATGGTVYGTPTAGTVYIEPDTNYYGLVGGSGAYINANATVATGTSEITFKQNFAVNSASAVKADGTVNVTVNMASANVTGEKNPRIYAAVYDSQDNCIAKDYAATTSDMTSKTFSMPADTASATSCVIYMWDENQKPLIKEFRTTVE